MGGAANTVQRVATGVATGGFSEIGNIPGTGKVGGQISNVARNAASLNPIPYSIAAGARTAAGVQTIQNAPKDAAIDAARTAHQDQTAAAAAADELKRRPKQTAPDNFLANKNKMLQSMRLGLANFNLRGAAGAAAPSLSAPSLAGGKSLLGS